MKKTEFNELIEKAFSMGYEIGQKEFGQVKRENKKKKRTYELLKGINDFGNEYFSGGSGKEIINKIIKKEREKQKSTYWRDNPIKDIHSAILQKTRLDTGANRSKLPDFIENDKIPSKQLLKKETYYDHIGDRSSSSLRDLKNISKELAERKTR